MNFAELKEAVAALPGVGAGTAGWVVAYPRFRSDYSAGYTLVRDRDGSFTVVEGFDRGQHALLRNEDGSTRRFADEDAACRWVLARVTANVADARSSTPIDDAALTANREAQEARVRARIEALRNSEHHENP